MNSLSSVATRFRNLQKIYFQGKALDEFYNRFSVHQFNSISALIGLTKRCKKLNHIEFDMEKDIFIYDWWKPDIMDILKNVASIDKITIKANHGEIFEFTLK